MSTNAKQSTKNKLALFFVGTTLAATNVALPAVAQSGTQEFGWLSEEVQNDQHRSNEFCRWWYNQYVNDGTLAGGGRNVRANLSSKRCLVDY